MCVWRLRNHKEVETLCEELSGVYDAKTVMDLYRHAAQDPFSFMFVRLDAKTRRDMFWLRFDARLLPTEESEDDGQSLGDSTGTVQQERKDGSPNGQAPQRSKQTTGPRR